MNSLIIFVIIVLVVVFFVKREMPRWIGKIGEKFVTEKLLELDKTHYKVLNDLLLPSNGSLNTTQIDHVVISNYGIFCIETKTYQGWIFGNVHQKYWTQSIFRYKKRFYNPLLQNYAHIKAVEDLVKDRYPREQILLLVVFHGADKLKITGTDLVGFTRDVVRKIKSFTNVIFSDTERDEIYEILMKANIIDKKTRRLHDRGVRELKR